MLLRVQCITHSCLRTEQIISLFHTKRPQAHVSLLVYFQLTLIKLKGFRFWENIHSMLMKSLSNSGLPRKHHQSTYFLVVQKVTDWKDKPIQPHAHGFGESLMNSMAKPGKRKLQGLLFLQISSSKIADSTRFVAGLKDLVIFPPKVYK